MKFYLIVSAITILFSSCLKESIPNAMLAEREADKGGVTATMSYEVNGDPVKITVEDADNQDPDFYTLGCSKFGSIYGISGYNGLNELLFSFFTDNLTAREYAYTGNYGEMFFLRYNGESEYVQAPTDFLTFIITSYNNGHISGTFSGKLTPLISAGNPNNIFGVAGSILVTKGTFQNVPVF